MKQKLIYVIFGIVIIASLGVIFRSQIQAALFPVKVVHHHAGFQVYENGKQKSFAEFQHMHDMPCGKEVSSDPAEEQMQRAHLHELVGDVVHVHRGGATWGDLFTNINYPIDREKIAEVYINGEKVNELLGREIQPYESVIIFIGKRDENLKQYLDKQVAKDHILKTEKRSEQCGTTEKK